MVSDAGIRDQVVFASPAALRVPAFRVIDRTDGLPPGEQLLGTALAVVAMCEAIGMNPHELIVVARNAMADVEGPFTYHLQAIRDYAKHEIKRTAR